MSRTQLLLGAGEISTGLIGHPQSARNFVCRSSLATLTRLVIGLVVMALIVIGLTNPSGAQTSGLGTESLTSSAQRPDGIPTLFARCSMTGMPVLTKKNGRPHASVSSSNVGPIFPGSGNNLSWMASAPEAAEVVAVARFSALCQVLTHAPQQKPFAGRHSGRRAQPIGSGAMTRLLPFGQHTLCTDAQFLRIRSRATNSVHPSWNAVSAHNILRTLPFCDLQSLARWLLPLNQSGVGAQGNPARRLPCGKQKGRHR